MSVYPDDRVMMETVGVAVDDAEIETGEEEERERDRDGDADRDRG